MSATDIHHCTVCPVCWLDRETRYADDEYRRHGRWPIGLRAPVDTSGRMRLDLYTVGCMLGVYGEPHP